MRPLRLRSGILIAEVVDRAAERILAAKVKLVEVTRDQIFLSSLYKNCFAILAAKVKLVEVTKEQMLSPISWSTHPLLSECL